MKARRVLLMLGGIVLAGVLAVVLWPGERQPEYKGKKLRRLLEIAYEKPRNSHEREEAFIAIRHIGTNALPLFVKWISYEPPMWKYTVRNRLLPLVGHVPTGLGGSRLRKLAEGDWERRTDLAQFGLRILGPTAVPAVPELTRLVNQREPFVCERAMQALAGIGKPGMPGLLAALREEGRKDRGSAARWLIEAYRNAGDMESAIPVIKQCLADRDRFVIRDTLFSVAPSELGQQAGFNPAFAVPAFSTLTHHSDMHVRLWALDALAEYGKDARPAMVVLTESLGDPEFWVRVSATNALEKIAPEVLTNGVSAH